MTDPPTFLVLMASPIILAIYFIKQMLSGKGERSVGEMVAMSVCLGLAMLAILGLLLKFPSKFP